MGSRLRELVSVMIFLALLVSTGLGITVGFGLGRAKAWLAKHEEKPKSIDLDNPLLKTRLRLKGGIVKGTK